MKHFNINTNDNNDNFYVNSNNDVNNITNDDDKR